ncbi:hypothetical protein DFA_05931 [Cavenderia fasciculata]|uniref:Coactosin n=1 Tax=Cavenderia fasciculata TaxID=261658 RepID=F4PJM1_CACFS|nr:uncharacterized protein DFA_05931 [Cavenderia fasciculata]EGG23795.1 hypothetical protein DFA_05931 [Cavenderia fasciculata]|eukprot:XP_004361646.1 hypothetical protein DFA_05931 [Cavenderia fasciculata]
MIEYYFNQYFFRIRLSIYLIYFNCNNVKSIRSRKPTIGDIHTSGHPTNWILVGYDGSPNQIKLIGSGNGGVNELAQHLDDSIMAYGIARVVDKVDGIPTDRYAYITWIGQGVKGMDKARYGTNKAHITKLLGHYNIEIAADQRSDITETEVMNRIQDASGSRDRTGEVKKANTTYGNVSSLKNPTTTTVKVPGANTSSVGLTFSDELASIVQEVKDGKNQTNWMLIGYQGKESLVFVAKGTGGVDELAQHLSDTQAYYGIVKTADQIDQSVTYKYGQINFVGVNVSPLLKGRITSHKGTIDKFFSPVHVVINGEQQSEITDSIFQNKVKALKGN